jgi:hypothetical protein
VAIGFGSVASGAETIAIGDAALSGAGTGSIAIGDAASVNSSAAGGVAIGDGASVGNNANAAVAVGAGASATGRSVAVGGGSPTGNVDGSTSVGYSADVSNGVGTAVGFNATASGSSGSTAIGGNAVASGSNSISIGTGSGSNTAGLANSIVVGVSFVAKHADSVVLGGCVKTVSGTTWAQHSHMTIGQNINSTTFTTITGANSGNLSVDASRNLFVQRITVWAEEVGSEQNNKAMWTITGGIAYNNAGTVALAAGGFIVTELFDTTTNGAEVQVVASGANILIQGKSTAGPNNLRFFGVVEYVTVDR